MSRQTENGMQKDSAYLTLKQGEFSTHVEHLSGNDVNSARSSREIILVMFRQQLISLLIHCVNTSFMNQELNNL